jgi:hypothetical protein
LGAVAETARSRLHGHGLLVLAVDTAVADLVVEHHRLHVAVAQHALEGVERHTAFSHVRRERVAEGVGVNTRNLDSEPAAN